MLSKREIQEKVNEEYVKLRESAVSRADNLFDSLKQNKEFYNNYCEINKLNFEIAKKLNRKEDVSKEKEKLSKLNQTKKAILKKLGIPLASLSPNYTCKLCNDTGRIGSKFCSCYKRRLSMAMLKESGLNTTELKTMKDFDTNVCTDQDEKHKAYLKKLKQTLTEFTVSFPKGKFLNLFVYGPTGVGKTYGLECVASELINKGYFVNFVTAFQLNTIFLNYHSSFDKDKQNMLESLLDPDLLIIDDLGSEPVFNNITSEYLYLILSERHLKHKSTFFSSNCSPRDIFDRYGERVFSRMFNKSATYTLLVDGLDLRLYRK